MDGSHSIFHELLPGTTQARVSHRLQEVPHTRQCLPVWLRGHLSPSYRTLATDSEIWREAGILSGTLARLQGYKSDQRRRVLNDALLFATARKHGCSVLTRNVLDFDFLQQLDPSGKVLFYR